MKNIKILLGLLILLGVIFLYEKTSTVENTENVGKYKDICFVISDKTKEGIELEFFVRCQIRNYSVGIEDKLKYDFKISLNNTSIYNIEMVLDNYTPLLTKDSIEYISITSEPSKSSSELIKQYSNLKSL